MVWSDKELDEQPTSNRKLRGWVKYSLVDDLVEGIKTYEALAIKYDVSPQRIGQFKKQNEELIDERRKNAADEFAGMWIAKKKNRVAAYEADVDRIDELELDPQWTRIKHAALKSVAEELGQLKTYIDAETRVNYTVDGVDMDKLQ